MSNFPNPEEQSEKINDNMENQIFSILKGVGIIEDSESELDEIRDNEKGNLFGFDDLNDSDLNQNTIINQQNFLRNQNKKSLTFQNDNNMMFKNVNNEIFRKKKCQFELLILKLNQIINIQIIHLIKIKFKGILILKINIKIIYLLIKIYLGN